MTERVIAILEARMGSTRLPGKSMMHLAGVPLVQRVAERVARAQSVDCLVVATTDMPGDDVLADHMARAGFTVYRGSEEDVLARILGASRAAGSDIHVQCWGDCPLTEPAEIDRVVDALRHDPTLDLVGNTIDKANRRLPYGLDVLALRRTALERAEIETRLLPYHREHGTTWIYENPTQFRVHCLDSPTTLSIPGFNATINTAEDYEFMRSVYGVVYSKKHNFDLNDVRDAVRSTPELQIHPNAQPLLVTQ